MINHVGIRADEDDRKGYMVCSRRNIVPKYPFIEDGITKEDVLKILDDSGIGLPDNTDNYDNIA